MDGFMEKTTYQWGWDRARDLLASRPKETIGPCPFPLILAKSSSLCSILLSSDQF